jgi:putative FmdB family regulatory protein
MPTYEYACEACGHHWEAVQSMKDDALKKCEKCKKPKAKRLISAGTGFILKGGGWYSDLYSSSKATKESSTHDTKSESSSDTSTTSSDKSTHKGSGKSDSSGDGKSKTDGAKKGAGKSAKSSSSSKD